MESHIMTEAYFSRSTEGEVGSFYYQLAMIAFTLSDPAEVVLNQIKAGKPIGSEEFSEDDLLRIAYELMGVFHEMRHYFDAFGTIAGISLFSSRLSVLKEFVRISQALRQLGKSWVLPLADWAKSPNCVQPVRDFISNAKGFSVAAEIFVAPFSPVEVDGHMSDLLIELQYERGGTTVAFPRRFKRIESDGVEKLRSVLMPVGLEALMEGNAHAICRDFSATHFPPEISSMLAEMQPKTVIIEAGGDGEQVVAQSAMPYMVTDLLISRYFSENGMPHFRRDLVLALTDHVLMRGVIRPLDIQQGATAIHVDSLGAHLVNLLVGENPKELADGRLPEQPEVEQAFDGILAAFERSGDWETIEDDESPLSSLAIWETYVAKHCIVPLLRLRKSTSNKAFRSVGGFMEALDEIGMPPVRVVNDSLLFELPPRVQAAWWHQLMLEEILRQLVADNDMVLCPRAHSTLPGIHTANLAFDSECERNVQLGCGTFRKSGSSLCPNCLFEGALKVCGLER
jgi:hypothetical protein